jgi:hypothetical protein
MRKHCGICSLNSSGVQLLVRLHSNRVFYAVPTAMTLTVTGALGSDPLQIVASL